MKKPKNIMKNLMGFNSPYSWVKYIRISVALFVLIAVYLMFSGFGFSGDMGFFGFIIMLIIILVFAGPALLVGLAVSLTIGAIVAGIQGKKRRDANILELKATGSDKLIDLDKRRVKLQTASFFIKPLKWVLRVVIVILVIISGLTINGEGVESGGLIAVLIIVLIGVIALTFIVERKSKKFNADFKELVVKSSLESVFSNIEYKPGECFNEYTVKASGLIGAYNVFGGNDYLSADYMGRHFVQSDLHLQKEYEETVTDNEGNSHTETRYSTVFYGRLMMLDYDTISNEPVFIFDKRIFKGAGTAETELHAFNERFRIVAQNPISAMRMLTPQVLEGIVLATNRIEHPVSMSFVHDKMFVAVHGLNAFEASTVGNANLSEQRRRVLIEIQGIMDMVGNLNTK